MVWGDNSLKGNTLDFSCNIFSDFVEIDRLFTSFHQLTCTQRYGLNGLD